MRGTHLHVGLVLALVVACVVGGVLFVTRQPTYAAFLVGGICLAAVTFYSPLTGLGVLVVMMLFSPEMSVGETAYRSFTVRGDDLMIPLIVFGWLAHAARFEGRIAIPWTPVSMPIIIMALIIVASGLFNILVGNLALTAALMFGVKRLEYFVVFFMVVSILRTWRETMGILVVFLCACVVVGIVGLIQHFAYGGTELVAGGVTSTFGLGEANTLGGFSLMVFCVALGLATGVEQTWPKLATLACAAVAGLCLVFTYSRGAFVGFVFALPTLLVFDRTRQTLRYAILCGIPVATLLAVVVMVGAAFDIAPIQSAVRTFTGQVGSIASVAMHGPAADASMRARWVAWEQALDYFLHNPVVGMGVGSRPMGWYDSHWVRELAETGLLGILTFVWLQIAAFRLCLKARRTAVGTLRGVATGLLAAQVGLWVHGFSAENFYTIRTTEPFFFLLGLVAVGCASCSAEAAEEEPERELQHATA